MGCSSSTDTGVKAAPPSSKAETKITRGASHDTKSTTETTKSNGLSSGKTPAVTFSASTSQPGTVSNEQADAIRSELEPVNTSDTASTSPGDRTPGYSSGATTPVDRLSSQSSDHSLDGHGSDSNNSLSSNGGSGNSISRRKSTKTLVHSTSAIGLDSMIESRKEEGNLNSNVVHIEVPFGKPIEEVYDGVHNGPVLGSGISGLVRLVTHKATGIKYAVKCLDLGLVETEEGLQQLREEIFIMCQLDHPNIVRLEEVYESHSEIYLVQELCLGGELFDRLDEQPDYHYTEAQCARLVKQMLCSVRYLHSKGIIHRDLKLENFLFSSTNPDSELKMIDFGLSKHFKFGEVHHEAVGTPYTVAPEVISGSYDERCDVWAIGVIAFLLLSGDPPFGGCGGPEPLMQVRSNILKGYFEFEPEDIWQGVSQYARDFITTLLVTDPSQRPTAKGAQKHHWLREWSHRGKTEDDNKLSPNVVNALVSFKEFSDMRKLLCEVLSFTLLPEQITDLRREFEVMDTDGSGEISLDAMKEVLIKNAGDGSLGALTEEEVEDIFNAMRVRKSEKRIHWHEFIAAGLSQAQVDDRNLRLAFDRLDSDHKGYITFENVMDLMGNDAVQSEDAMRQMWGDSMKAVNCSHARITYEDFLLLMKGQTREVEPVIEPKETEILPPDFQSIMKMQSGRKLEVLHEVKSADGSTTVEEDKSTGDIVEPLTSVNELVLPSGEKVTLGKNLLLGDDNKYTRSPMRPHPASAPVTPINHRQIIQLDDDFETPLSMDDDDDVDLRLSQLADKTVSFAAGPTLPGLEKRPASLSPPSNRRDSIGDGDNESSVPPLPSMKLNNDRIRSRSFDDSGHHKDYGIGEPHFDADARRAMLLPEHEHNNDEIDDAVKDESLTPLVVNRKLYRAHRQMRLAVLEASKRFEEEQTRRAHDILLKQKEGNEDGDVPGKIGAGAGAGLVMRHGLNSKQVSSEAVKQFLLRNKQTQQSLIDKANVRVGRGRRTRKKTVSDMAGMMSQIDQKDFEASKSPEPSKSLTPSTPPIASPTAEPTKKNGKKEEKTEIDDLDIDSIIRATVPGQFRKARDPFSDGGRYGEYVPNNIQRLGNSMSNVTGGSYSLGDKPTQRTFNSVHNVFPARENVEDDQQEK